MYKTIEEARTAAIQNPPICVAEKRYATVMAAYRGKSKTPRFFSFQYRRLGEMEPIEDYASNFTYRMIEQIGAGE